MTVDAFSGLLPGPGTVATVKEMFIKGTEPTRRDNLHVDGPDRRARPACSGRTAAPGRWQTRPFLDFSQAEERLPAVAAVHPGLGGSAPRAASASAAARRTTRTMYFYNLSFHPFGATWGGRFKPTEVCQRSCPVPAGGPPTPEPSDRRPVHTPADADQEQRHPTDPPGPTPTKKPGPRPTPDADATAAPAPLGRHRAAGA